jgi:hypothetical protein
LVTRSTVNNKPTTGRQPVTTNTMFNATIGVTTVNNNFPNTVTNQSTSINNNGNQRQQYQGHWVTNCLQCSMPTGWVNNNNGINEQWPSHSPRHTVTNFPRTLPRVSITPS